MLSINIKIPNETCEAYKKVLTYINKLEDEHRELNAQNNGKDYSKDLDWLEAKVCAVNELFDLLNNNPSTILVYDNVRERWTIHFDIGSALLDKEDS